MLGAVVVFMVELFGIVRCDAEAFLSLHHHQLLNVKGNAIRVQGTIVSTSVRANVYVINYFLQIPCTDPTDLRFFSDFDVISVFQIWSSKTIIIHFSSSIAYAWLPVTSVGC